MLRLVKTEIAIKKNVNYIRLATIMWGNSLFEVLVQNKHSQLQYVLF